MLIATVLATELPSLVLLIIDGCGTNHHEAARLVEFGGNDDISLKKMDQTTLLSTQNAVFQLTDSAAAATAISCGLKTLNGRMGMDQHGRNVQNIIEYLRQHHPEYLTGVVSKVESTHATPGTFLAHSMDRGSTKELWQSIADYSKADLIIGGGDYADGFQALKGVFKKQGYNIIQTADFKHDRNVLKKTKLPMFAAVGEKSLPYFIDYPTALPTLQEMTSAAIERLSSNGAPFFLMVEASLNDYGSHNNNISQLVGEMIEADQVLAYLLKLTETMPNFNVIVAADHETGGLTLPTDLSALNVDAAPIPSANYTLEQNNRLRSKRIELLGAHFSTTAHSNAPVIVGFSGPQLKTVRKDIQTTSDLRPFMQEFLTGEAKLTPYDGLVKNGAENIFAERLKYYTERESENEEENQKHSPTKALVLGILSGLLGAALILLIVYLGLKSCRKTKGYHHPHGAPLLNAAAEGMIEKSGLQDQ